MDANNNLKHKKDKEEKHPKESDLDTEEKENKEIEQFEKRIIELEDQFKRAVADYRNLERRVDEERRETIKLANKDLIISLLPAFDTLFLAGKYTQDQGVKLTIQRILEVLKENGIEKVATDNLQYNPETMECVEVVEGEKDKVVEEMRPGFLLYGKLIRPAQVKVGK